LSGLGLFSNKRGTAQRKYRVFVQEGLRTEAPWGELKGQVLLGKENFTEKFKALLSAKEHIKEIPRHQRYVSRPELEKLFKATGKKDRRNKTVYAAHVNHGYKLSEIANHLQIHYTTVSKIIAKVEAQHS